MKGNNIKMFFKTLDRLNHDTWVFFCSIKATLTNHQIA